MQHRSLALLFFTCLAAPALGRAQTIFAPAAPTDAPQPPIRLFKDTVPESSPTLEITQSPNWWEPPTIGSDIPRWMIGHTVKLNTAGGFSLSAGLFGRKGDPLPLYLSEGTTQRLAANNAMVNAGSYQVQWDAKFGVTAPLRNTPRLKMDAIGELFVPLTGSIAFPKSRVLKFGIVTGF